MRGLTILLILAAGCYEGFTLEEVCEAKFQEIHFSTMEFCEFSYPEPWTSPNQFCRCWYRSRSVDEDCGCSGEQLTNPFFIEFNRCLDLEPQLRTTEEWLEFARDEVDRCG